MANSLPTEGTVLDIGSASGDYAIDLTTVKRSILCSDIDRESLRISRIKKRELLLVQGDAHYLPFKSQSVEGIMILNALRYFRDPRAALTECSRVLKLHGKLILIDHNRLCPDSLVVGQDVESYYSQTELRALVADSGLIVVREDQLFMPHRLVPAQLLGCLEMLSNTLKQGALKVLFPEILLVCERIE